MHEYQFKNLLQFPMPLIDSRSFIAQARFPDSSFVEYRTYLQDNQFIILS